MNFGNRGGMTVRVTFRKENKEFKMLFGNSYKYWYTQATEYIYRNHGSETEGWRYSDLNELEILEVEKSHSPWVGWGGLKWCTEDLFQEELNREGVQQNEPDNLKPRQYDNFKFDYYNYGYRKLIKELKEY